MIVHPTKPFLDKLPVSLGPDDLGGWAEFVAVMADPENPERAELSEWARAQWWHPFNFDATARGIAAMA